MEKEAKEAKESEPESGETEGSGKTSESLDWYEFGDNDENFGCDSDIERFLETEGTSKTSLQPSENQGGNTTAGTVKSLDENGKPYKYYCLHCDNRYGTNNFKDFQNHLLTELSLPTNAQRSTSETQDWDLIQDQSQLPEKSETKQAYLCQLCDFKCSNDATMRYHKKREHPKIYFCPICGYICPEKETSEISYHCESEHPDIFFCQLCDFYCPEIEVPQIDYHCYNEHPGIYFCLLCPFMCPESDPDKITDHIERGHEFMDEDSAASAAGDAESPRDDPDDTEGAVGVSRNASHDIQGATGGEEMSDADDLEGAVGGVLRNTTHDSRGATGGGETSQNILHDFESPVGESSSKHQIFRCLYTDTNCKFESSEPDTLFNHYVCDHWNKPSRFIFPRTPELVLGNISEKESEESGNSTEEPLKYLCKVCKTYETTSKNDLYLHIRFAHETRSTSSGGFEIKNREEAACIVQGDVFEIESDKERSSSKSTDEETA